jgi:hypothetical protein
MISIDETSKYEIKNKTAIKDKPEIKSKFYILVLQRLKREKIIYA